MAQEIRKRMLAAPAESRTLSDVAHSLGAPPEIAEAALRAVRERKAPRRPALWTVIALILVLLSFVLAGFFFTSLGPATAPPLPGGATTVVPDGTAPTAPEYGTTPSLPPGDWQVDATVKGPSELPRTDPTGAADLAKALDSENAAFERTVLQNGGNFDHLEDLRSRAQGTAASLEAKVEWNEVLRGNLRMRGLLTNRQPG
ncbi:MAG: hypothetical protein IT207_03685 [Fimbriimonadaceae bacterium]|nr:hypothetical protein [Fimbriimonadaceae bacterium]